MLTFGARVPDAALPTRNPGAAQAATSMLTPAHQAALAEVATAHARRQSALAAQATPAGGFAFAPSPDKPTGFNFT